MNAHASRGDLPPHLLPVFDKAAAALKLGESVLLVGPPGCGKTMIARRLAATLEDRWKAYASENETIQRMAGLNVRRESIRPPVAFRAPHHTVSVAGMLGGGRPARPGEVSLAHGGLLFIDEAPEFSLTALNGVHHARKKSYVDVWSSHGRWRIPSNFALVGSANPCPCGYLGNPKRACTCSATTVSGYLRRIPKGMFTLTINVPAAS